MSDLAPLQTLGYQRREVERSESQLQQEQFLEIMIAQLRAQDPTSPQDSNQFLGQLAQFGTVEGIGDLNANFELMSTALSANQALQAANLVDREVMVPGSRAFLSASTGSLRGAAELPNDSQRVVVRVIDESGAVVRHLELPDQRAGLVDFEWDGLDQSGSPLPEGTYFLEAEAYFGGQPQALPTLVSARVQSVTFGNGAGPTLVELEGLGPHPLNEVRQIRSAPEARPIAEEPIEADVDPETIEGVPSTEELAFGRVPAKFYRLPNQ